MRTPLMESHKVSAKVDYVQKAIGLTPAQLPAAAIPPLLEKMMLGASLSPTAPPSTPSCRSRAPT